MSLLVQKRVFNRNRILVIVSFEYENGLLCNELLQDNVIVYINFISLHKSDNLLLWPYILILTIV